ncbi:LysR family transcriptional regulator [Burkholderia cenocepacia]|uniref:LysR family transcriptional regulator n=1 Tax=Burkholderia cenocepacia TaxID=95486 RepID=UPI001639D90A|nr:LysR family transcriptional regulator [Burkholderia cenocepacia]
MIDFNLRLASIFNLLFETKSVSATAERLGMTPSSVSMSLARLREQFRDPLFVRTSHGMEATPRAALLVERLREAEQLVEDALNDDEVFDPTRSTREFRIATTDLGEMILLPVLYDALARVAPAAKLTFTHVTQDTPRQIQNGDVDLALGCISHLENGFYQQQLFRETFVCIYRTGHPGLTGAPTRADFLAARHLVVSVAGSGYALIDKALERCGIQRDVAIRLPGLLAMPAVLGTSDLVATVPQRLGRLLETVHGLKCASLPFELAPIDVKQYWHERYQFDAGLAWLRRLNRLVLGEGCDMERSRGDVVGATFGYPDSASELLASAVA